MRRLFAALLLLPALMACDKAQDPSTEASSATSLAAPLSAAASAPVAAPTGTAREVKIDNELITFEYAYPAVAAAIPGLKAFLEADIADRKAELEANAPVTAAVLATVKPEYRASFSIKR